jgi:hypothetical protein
LTPITPWEILKNIQLNTKVDELVKSITDG